MEERTELSALGEFKLIEHLTQSIKLQQKSTVLGIGDDAAIIDSAAQHTVVSTDMLVEGIHFNLMYTPLRHLGYKAVAVNVSDICAMNAIPTQITVSIAVSNRYSVEAMEELYEGITAACDAFGVDLVGGDTTSNSQGMTLSITAIGHADSETITKRSGAKDKDLLCVSGDVGGAYLGLQILEREKEVFTAGGAQPDLERYQYILERQLKPEARLDIINALSKNNIVPTSMIDVSDGLGSEILHLSKSSNLGFRVYENKIPIDFTSVSTAEELKMNPTTCALNGGEDYELLFTIAPDDYPKLATIADIKTIGHAVDVSEGVNLVSGDQLIPIKAQGWKSF